MVKLNYFLIIGIIILLMSCTEKNTIRLKNDSTDLSSTIDPEGESNSSKSMAEKEFNKSSISGKYTLADFFKNNPELDRSVDEIFNSMNDEEKISQMIVQAAGKYGKSETEILDLIKKKRIGGVLLLKGSKSEFKSYINAFNKESQNSNSLPLIFSADAEPSLVNSKITGLKKINATNTIKNIEESSATANEISSILKDIGINQNFAPVCDFSKNKEIIGNRSFGNNTDELIKLSGEFIKKTQENNIIATAKHFPGHGNVTGDSHKELVYIKGELKELDVFKEMVKIGVLSIMVGHIAIENNEKYNTDGLPSTLSRKIVTDLLRNDLGFEGLVITDAMNMEAVTQFQSPSLKAIEAGCDIVLMPSDEVKLINSVKEKMDKDQEFREQVYESVRRVLRVKLGIIRYS